MFTSKPHGLFEAFVLVTHTWVLLFYMTPLTIITLTATLPRPSYATTGFDCENQSSKVGTINLEQVGQCAPFNSTYGREETVMVQVLQRSYRTSIPVYACQLRMSREVCACRFFTNSHFGCQDVVIDELKYVSPKACWQAVETKSFSTEEFSVKGLKIGMAKSVQFFSHGSRDSEGNCDVANFVRAGRQFRKSYEKSTATILIKAIPAHTADGAVAGTHSDDILLPDGLRLPATKLFYSNPALGTVVWRYTPATCDPKIREKAVTQLYRGPMTLRKKLTAPESQPLMGSLLTVHPTTAAGTRLEKAFGLALKFPTSICGLQAHQTNLEQTFAIMLREGDEGVDTKALSVPANPHLIALATQNSLLHISTNLRISDMHEEFYKQICDNERKGLLNMLRNIRTSDSHDVIAPLFGRGHMVLKSGSVAHIIECTPVDVQVDLSFKGCTKDVPVLKQTANETQEKLFMHPISRILTPTSSELPCSSKFPMVFRLDDDNYVCNTGAGMTRCIQPKILKPKSNNMPISEWFDFAKALSIGIMSVPEINKLSLRLHHHAYQQHIEDGQVMENLRRGNIGVGSNMKIILDTLQITDLHKQIAKSIAPLFYFVGEAYFILFGVLCTAMILAYITGTFSRMITEYRISGCGPWLLLTFVGNLWNVWRIPAAMVNGAAKAAQEQGAHGAAEKLDNLILAQQMDKLALRMSHVEASDQRLRNDNANAALGLPAYEGLDDVKDNATTATNVATITDLMGQTPLATAKRQDTTVFNRI